MGSMKDFHSAMQPLGKGSYGSVFKCKRRSDGCYYAVKEINIKKLSVREREDAVNEIRVLASIRHTNIVRYCDAFVEKDNLYIVMEFAERGDIYHKIKKYKEANRCIREDVIWSYFIQICRGLNELHSRRILHRDIKPKNVFLTSKDHVRIGDLGCSKVMKSSLARTQIGTPYYMSPEIWSKQAYDEKSDMWALGCLLFELCSMQPPFLAKDVTGLAQKVKTAQSPLIPRHYSSDLQSLVQRLLVKTPASRPSIQEVLAMPCMASRMHLVPPPDSTDPWALDARPSHILDTIKVPKNLGMRKLALDLPEPCYPSRGRSMSPDRREAGAGFGDRAAPPTLAPIPATGAGAGAGGGGGSGAAAVVSGAGGMFWGAAAAGGAGAGAGAASSAAASNALAAAAKYLYADKDKERERDKENAGVRVARAAPVGGGLALPPSLFPYGAAGAGMALGLPAGLAPAPMPTRPKTSPYLSEMPPRAKNIGVAPPVPVPSKPKQGAARPQPPPAAGRRIVADGAAAAPVAAARL